MVACGLVQACGPLLPGDGPQDRNPGTAHRYHSLMGVPPPLPDGGVAADGGWLAGGRSCRSTFPPWRPPPPRSSAVGRPSGVGGEPQRRGAPCAATDPRVAIHGRDMARRKGGCGGSLPPRRAAHRGRSRQRVAGVLEERLCSSMNRHGPEREARLRRRGRSGEDGVIVGGAEGLDGRRAYRRTEADDSGRRHCYCSR